jgi:hypothetical protein
MYTIKQLNLSNKARYKYISRLSSRKLTHPELPPNSILTELDIRSTLICICVKRLVYDFTKRNIYLITIWSNLLVKSRQHQNLLWRHVYLIIHVFQSFIVISEDFSLENLVIFEDVFFEGPDSSSITSTPRVANSVSLAPSDIVKFLSSSISS